MSKIRKAARTVIVDGEKTAIIDVGSGEYYKIPGGGLEEDETDEQAAKREAEQEAGCEVELLGKLGDYEFMEKETDTIHPSVCYLARVVGQKKETEYENHEKERSFKLIWVTFDEAKKLFGSAKPGSELKENINRRDLWFLEKGEIMNREISNEIKMKNFKLK